MTMRLLLASFQHETNSFSPVPTPLSRFSPDGGKLLSGDAAIAYYDKTASVMGGMLDAARESGAEIEIPVAAEAVPSGPVNARAYEDIAGRIVSSIARSQPDGILLDLHGAMIATHVTDGEGELLRRIRVVAPDTPIAVTLDMHANLTANFARLADIVTGYHTYPHVDMADAGLRAGRLLARAVRGEIRPRTAFGQRPMLPHIMRQGTFDGPNADLQALACRLEERDVLAASLFMGFPHGDVPFAGVSALAISDGDDAAAQRAIDRLLDGAWNARHGMLFTPEPLAVSIQRAGQAKSDKPVILLDHCDNAFSGGTMDSTTVLRAILESGLGGVAFFAIHDPAAVAQAIAAGQGATVAIDVGGKAATPAMPSAQSGPVRLEGRVATISDGRFRQRGPLLAGLEVHLGPAVTIDTGRVEVVLISRQQEPIDIGCFEVAGIEPLSRRFLAIKSRVHWRAGLGPIADTIIECMGSGVCTSDYAQLPFRHVRRPIFPLDPDMTPH